MRRWALAVVAALGLALIAAPFAFRMFDRAPKGAEMMAEFKPYMTEQRLTGFQQHIRDIDGAVKEADGAVARRLEGRGAAAHRRFERRFPGFAQFAEDWPPINDDMSNLMDTIHANAGNYRAISALPDFKLFPWFFVIPGAIVLLLALGTALAPRARPGLRWALVALGIGLVLAPVAFGMFARAPKGGRMMDAFATLETRHKVETMQGYFATIGVGQGALRLEIVPALRRDGLSSREIAARFPDVTRLNKRWIPILNDMTPMIGAMSDNVDNYQAVKSMPPFPLFPWFFVVPGLLIAGLMLASGPRRRRTAAAIATGPLSPRRQGGAL